MEKEGRQGELAQGPQAHMMKNHVPCMGRIQLPPPTSVHSISGASIESVLDDNKLCLTFSCEEFFLLGQENP